MRILVDEQFPRNGAQAIAVLGHDVTHVAQTRLRGADDIELARQIGQYDCFVTLDLHQQRPEWVAMSAALLREQVTIVRIRLPKRSNPVPAVLASVARKHDLWVADVERGVALVTISAYGEVLRRNTREEVEEMLARRRHD